MKFGLPIIPFDLNWLEEYFELDKASVINDEFEFDISSEYVMEFVNKDSALNFKEQLNKADVHPRLWSFENHKLHIPYDSTSSYKILRAAGITNQRNLPPFDIEFFQEFFGLNPELVEHTDHGIQFYDICFKERKDSEDFHKKMKELGCYPIWGGGHVSHWGRHKEQYRTVSFNADMVRTILMKAAANTLQLHKDNAPLSKVNIQNKVFPFFKEIVKTVRQEAQEQILCTEPFTLTWFLEHFPDHLDENFIIDSGPSSLLPHNFQLKYQDEFKQQAELFSDFLKTHKISLWHWRFSNTLEFNKHCADDLLELGERQKEARFSIDT